MANPEHIEIARAGGKALNVFRDTHPGLALNLRLADLSGVDLSTLDLRGLDLFRADLSRANLSGSNLNGMDLSGVNLSGVNLREANLSHANLSRADLTDANLFAANLTEANLSEAKMRWANLFSAILFGASLCKADLTGASLFAANLNNANLCRAILNWANLSWAKLRKADLRETDLTGATLNGTDLTGTVFQNTYLGRTIFGDVDLSETIGLELAQHRGRSTVGIDTLLRSNCSIPNAFLRGCGLPDDFIISLTRFEAAELDHTCCFISYTYSDEEFARKLHDHLQTQGIRCWLDPREFGRNDDGFRHEFDREIRDMDKVLLCVSRDSLLSPWIENEIRMSVEKERDLTELAQQNVLRMIPLNVDGFVFTDDWPSGLRQQVRDRIATDFTNWKTDPDEFDRQVQRVVMALRTDPTTFPEPMLPTAIHKKDQLNFGWPE